MMTLLLEDASVSLIIDGLHMLHEDAQQDGNEGRAERLEDLTEEIERQRDAQASDTGIDAETDTDD